jgi:two-component system cell cycle response regulator
LQERWVGALVGLTVLGLVYVCDRLPQGWALGAVLLTALGWGLGGYIRHLRRLAERDELTGLVNRRAFERALQREWERANRFGLPLSLLFLDVDDFGQVNKRYGHLMGDEALRQVCRRIRQHVRRTDVVSRWGGEEFAILLPGTDVEQAVQIAERIRAVVERSPVRDRDRVISITVSTGVAGYPGKAESADDLLRQAISGQLLAKQHKNTVEVVS